MSLRFKSSTPEVFSLLGRDTDGRERIATATRHSGEFNWTLKLTHPSGESWPGTFHGPNVLDALSELMRSKDIQFKQDRARGDRPREEPKDNSRSVEGDIATYVPRR